ncbi:hypothetical protein RB596_008538 [Gaeumannomyces avenae]
MSAASSTGSADGTTGLSAIQLGEAAATGDWSALFNRAVPDAESSGIYHSRQAREQSPTYQARVARAGAALAQRFNEVTGAPLADVTISTVSSHPEGRDRFRTYDPFRSLASQEDRQPPQQRRARPREIPREPVIAADDPVFEQFLKKYQEVYGGDSSEASQDNTRASVAARPSVPQAPQRVERSREDVSRALSRSSRSSVASRTSARRVVAGTHRSPAAPSSVPSHVPSSGPSVNRPDQTANKPTSTSGPSAPRSGQDATEPTSSISLTDFRHLHALMDGSLDFKFLESGRICFTKPRPPFHAYLKDCGDHENDDSVFSTSTTNDEKQILVTMAKIRDEVRTLFDHDTMLHAEATKLHEEIARLAAEINHLKSTRKRADSGVASDSDRSSKNVKVLEQELGELRVRHDQESKKTSVLEQHISTLDKHIDGLETLHEQECQKTKMLEKQIETLYEENITIQTLHQKECKKTHDLQKQIGVLQEQHMSVQTFHEKEHKMTHDLQKQIAVLEEHNTTIQTLHQKECKKTHDLQKQIGVLQEQNINIQALHKEERKRTLDLQKKSAVLEEQNIAIQTFHEKECKKIHDLQQQIGVLQEQNITIQTLHKEERKRTLDLQKKIGILQEQNVDTQTRQQASKKSHELQEQASKAPAAMPTAASTATAPTSTTSRTVTMPIASSTAAAPTSTTSRTATMPIASSTAAAPTSTTSRTATSSASRITTSTASKTTTTRTTSRVASGSSSGSAYSSAQSGSRATGVRDLDKIRVSIRRPAPLSREMQDREDDTTTDPRESADKNIAIVFRQVSREAKEASDRLVELIDEQSQNDPSISKRQGDALAREIKNVSELYQMKRRQVYRLRQTYSGLEKLGGVSDMNDFDVTVDSLGGI